MRQRAEGLRTLFEAKVRAELALADAAAPGSDTVRWSGEVLASVAAVKGRPGPAEASGGAALSGADGDALIRALEALGWAPPVAFATLSRPADGIDESALTERLRLQIEAVDPRVVIALDEVAAADLSTAFGIRSLDVGEAVMASGRRFVAVGGLEAALGDERTKRMVWRQLKNAAPDGPVY